MTELLAGRAATPQADRGPLVCVCHDVSETAIRIAVEHCADSVAAIGAKTCAGTNCGSCRPILARLPTETRNMMQEAAQ